MDPSLRRQLRTRADLPATTRISRKNQITLPVALLRKLNLRSGDELQVIANADGAIVLVPQRQVPDFRQFAGRLPMAATGDALVDELRGEVEGEC